MNSALRPILELDKEYKQKGIITIVVKNLTHKEPKILKIERRNERAEVRKYE